MINYRRDTEEFLEARARREQREQSIWRMLRSNPRPPVQGLLTGATQFENEAIALGCSSDEFARLFHPDDAIQVDGIVKLEGKLGIVRPLTGAECIERQDATARLATRRLDADGLDEEVRSVLLKLGLNPDLAGARTESEAAEIIARKGKA